MNAIGKNEKRSDFAKRGPKELPVRDKILRTAMVLFNRHGVHATGIDKIISESGVAKMSFYNHFPSKTNLIAAYLAEKDRERFESLEAFTIRKHKDPMRRLLGIFDSLENWVGEEDFCGCPFTRGLSDFANDPDSEPYAIVTRHFSKYESFVLDRLSELMPSSSAKVLVPQILSLIVGTVVIGFASRSAEIAQFNKRAARTLVEATLEKRK